MHIVTDVDGGFGPAVQDWLHALPRDEAMVYGRHRSLLAEDAAFLTREQWSFEQDILQAADPMAVRAVLDRIMVMDRGPSHPGHYLSLLVVSLWRPDQSARHEGAAAWLGDAVREMRARTGEHPTRRPAPVRRIQLSVAVGDPTGTGADGDRRAFEDLAYQTARDVAGEGIRVALLLHPFEPEAAEVRDEAIRSPRESFSRVLLNRVGISDDW